MAITIAFSGQVERLEILRKDGSVDEELLPDITDEKLVAAYKNMLWMRTFDDKAIKLQRQGRMGTWASLKGQEAAQAGLALAMGDADWLVPSFREHGVMLARGIPPELIYSYWKGDERGGAIPKKYRTLPPSVPIGSQLVHGAGLGYALKCRGENAVAVACGGDGATSEGDFHEALNFAGVYGAQTVFFIQNNGWAISLPVSRQTASQTLAQKALAYGFEGVQVDGNDILAVFEASRIALERARSGGGPTLIEAVTYRLGDHTTADEASRYRPDSELEKWLARDPLTRTKSYLMSRDLLNDAQDDQWQQQAWAQVNEAVGALESRRPPDPAEIFDSMYDQLPWNLEEQKSALLGRGEQ